MLLLPRLIKILSPFKARPIPILPGFPLSDVPVEVGGLQVAAGSHKQGVYDFQPALGAGGLAVINPLEGTWVSSPFEQGDVLIFHSMAVHKGLPNHSPKLRMSMDARYQRASEPIAPGSLEPHSKPHTWEEIYADWPHDDLKYYWKKWDLDVVRHMTIAITINEMKWLGRWLRPGMFEPCQPYNALSPATLIRPNENKQRPCWLNSRPRWGRYRVASHTLELEFSVNRNTQLFQCEVRTMTQKFHPLQLKVAKPQPRVISNSLFSRQSILLTNGLANGQFVICHPFILSVFS